MNTFIQTCNKLNNILDNRPENRDEFIKAINEIIFNEVYQKHGSLYWDRKLFINCNCDDELCRKEIDSQYVMFRATEDPEEHPGITLTYKDTYNEF